MSVRIDYGSFIDQLRQVGSDDGFEPLHLPDSLYPFQRDLTEWAIRKGRAAIFADCGLGKTLMQLTWADNVIRKTHRPVLILTPLAVSHQVVAEGEKFGFDVRRWAGIEANCPRIITMNYQRLHQAPEPGVLGGIVLDECFACGTPVDCVTLDGEIYQKHIEKIRPRDRIWNTSGVDTVARVYRREVPYAVRVTIGATVFICSPNHPIFTQCGWQAAQCLQPGDCALGTSAAMRMVRDDLLTEVPGGACAEVLRDILLSEMADEPTGARGEGTHAGDSSEARREEVGVATESGGTERGGAYSQPESDDESRDAGEGVSYVAEHEAQTFRAWGEWSWADGAAGGHGGCSWRRLDSGISLVVGATDTWLSDALQARHRLAGEENRRRGGWAFTLQPDGAGPEEGCETGFSRVDSIEILELGHPDLARLRDADGKLYFYDLGATRHPSYSVGGYLVHNSSILKSFNGKTRTAVTDYMRQIPYRLLCTATAAPNDHTELGTSSEALGYLGYMDMLSRFFRQVDHNNSVQHRAYGATAKWRFKGHAESPFWRWVCSWARVARRPSDLGYSDGVFILPDLEENDHVIENPLPRDGWLFATIAKNLREEREERRATLRLRCERVAELVESHDRSVIWCHLNDEGDELLRMIPDAVQVSGSDSDSRKEEMLRAFAAGEIPRLITKPKIGAWGLNLQKCAHVATFASHSYEQYYQAIRRCWRFGQTRPVTVDLVLSSGEVNVMANMRRKAVDADRMFAALVNEMPSAVPLDSSRDFAKHMEVPAWLMTN